MVKGSSPLELFTTSSSTSRKPLMEVKGCKICSPEKNDSSLAKDGEHHQFRRDATTRCKVSSSSNVKRQQHTVRRTHFSEKLELECDEAQIQGPSFLHNWRTPDRVEAAAAASPSHENSIWNRQQKPCAFTSYGGSLCSYQDENGRMKHSSITSRLGHGHRLRQINKQTLSPLVLHPRDGIMHSASPDRPHLSFPSEGYSDNKHNDNNMNEEVEDEDSDVSTDDKSRSSGIVSYQKKALTSHFHRFPSRWTQTKLEGYNGSEEFGGSSDNSDGSISMSELEGELDLESYCNGIALDKHNNQRRGLVKVDSMTEGELQITNISECKELGLLCEYKPRNLSQKYRPKVFEDVVGQHIVTRALASAISKGKIAPVYLFHGSRGTGKTSVARIFASALLCLLIDGSRPCGLCIECVSVASGTSSEVREVDAASNNGIERVKSLLEETLSSPPVSWYKVFVIDECHVLTLETWNALLKILEEPPLNVVFILTTTDPDQLPRTAVSRCQRFPFMKIRESEIVERLQRLAALEDLTIDIDALQLIASRSEGSLRDAEIILDQVSLLGHPIKSSTVYELVGSASDEKMLSLLDSALQADTVAIVRKARELIDSGVEPLSLMSRLATSITDILAGSFKFTENQSKGFFRKQPLSEAKLERLRMAMKPLVEAEKQLRASNDRATWLTAALLQLGPHHHINSHKIFPASCEGTSVTQSSVALDHGVGEDFEHRSSSGRQPWVEENETNMDRPPNENQDSMHVKSSKNTCNERSVKDFTSRESRGKAQVEETSKIEDVHDRSLQGAEKLSCFQGDDGSEKRFDRIVDGHNYAKLNDIWDAVVVKCGSQHLKELLRSSVKLVSISISEVDAVVNVDVLNPNHMHSFQRSEKSIAILFESVLGFPVEVRASLASLPETSVSRLYKPAPTCQGQQRVFQKQSINGCYQESNHPSTSGSFCPLMYATRNNMRLDTHLGYESCFERGRSGDGIEALSLESHGLAVLHEKSRNHAHGNGMDGRRSCDAHPQVMRTSNFKMIRRLSMRDHMKSPPSPDYDKNKGFIPRFPMFSNRSHTLPQKLAEPEEAQTSHKSNTLKGTLARFFLKETYKAKRRNE